MTRGRARLWQVAALAIALGAALRLWFIAHIFTLTGDTLLYGDIAQSWLQHGIYGFAQAEGDPLPTLIRLPGYPLFLMLCFRIFGPAHFHAVVYLQCLIDLLACLVLAALVRRIFGNRSALVALFLAALCPFTASYVAVPLTESLTCASIVLAFYALERWREAATSSRNPLDRKISCPPWHPWNHWLWILSAALAYSILLRPDQGLLAAAVLPAMLWPGRSNAPVAEGSTSTLVPKTSRFHQAIPILVTALLTLLPLVPWTIRNARTFHVFQPLAPRSATDPGEPVPTGFYRWYRTWGVDFSSTEDIYWNYDGAALEIADLPSRAFDSPAQRQQTRSVLEVYNLTRKPSPELDVHFSHLAEDRIQAHSARYFIGLPVARLVNMLFRPRTELLPSALDWWRFHEHPGETVFALAYATLNLAYFALGGLGLYRWTRRPHHPAKPLAWSMLAFLVLRCALLLTLDNSEPRYTLEFFPILITGAAALFVSKPPPLSS